MVALLNKLPKITFITTKTRLLCSLNDKFSGGEIFVSDKKDSNILLGFDEMKMED
jgi:hypothetical protein